MAIILEGPDAAGKSTLAKHICAKFGFGYYSSGGAPKNKDEEFKFLFEQHNLAINPKMVIDRVTAISQQVYANRLGDAVLDERLEALQDTKSIVVYCRPPNEALMRPEKHQWKDYDTEEHKQFILNNQHKLIERYDLLMSKIPHLVYDYTDADNFDWFVAIVVDSQDSLDGYQHALEIINESKCRYIS